MKRHLGAHWRKISRLKPNHVTRRFLSEATVNRRLRIAYSSSSSASDLAVYSLGTAVLMLGMAYASAPMYQALCKKFGWGGTTSRGNEERLKQLLSFQEERGESEKNRRILIRFETQVTPGMPWYFTPTQEYVVVRPGETALAFFTAYNDADRPITGVSTYSVLPFKAAPYFQKVQCFCFEEQRLRGKEKVDMPVLFYLEPSILEDRSLRDCYDITLAYTFFEVEEEEGEVEWDDDDDWPDEENTASQVPVPMLADDPHRIDPESYSRQILKPDDPMVALIKGKKHRIVDENHLNWSHKGRSEAGLRGQVHWSQYGGKVPGSGGKEGRGSTPQ